MDEIIQNEQISRTRALFETGAVHDKDFECFRNMTIVVSSILNIGANRGQSITSFKNGILAAKITCFEGNLQFFEFFDKVKERYDEVWVHKLVLGLLLGRLEFYLPRVDCQYIGRMFNPQR